MSDSSDDQHEDPFSFKRASKLTNIPIGTKNKTTTAEPTTNTTTSSRTSMSVESIANKYAKKPTPPAQPTTTETAASDEDRDPFQSKSTATPKFDRTRPTSSTASTELKSPLSQSSAVRTQQTPTQANELEDSINPGASPIPIREKQPGGPKTMDDTSFFTDDPFQLPAAKKAQAKPTTTGTSKQQAADTTRYSYLDPKDSSKLKKRPTTESDPSSDEETPFQTKIKPVIKSNKWNQSIEPTNPTTRAATASSSQSNQPTSSPSVRGDDEHKYDESQSTLEHSPIPPVSAPFPGSNDMSRDYRQLQADWIAQEEEVKRLKAALNQQQQFQQSSAQPFQMQQSASPIPHATGSSSQQRRTGSSSPQRPSTSITADLDALNELQMYRADEQANEVAARGFLLNDSYYPNNVELHEVLADHKRLRQRLRAAQHAIEALAAGSEPGAVDGAATLGAQIRASTSSSQLLSSSPTRSRRGYAPALQSPPSSLSLSQYAHLPPARAVLKLLNRLEREEESYLSDRQSWKAERKSLTAQLSALTADLRHLTTLAQQAQQNEAYFRKTERVHAETLERMKSEREQERARWAEVEKDLRDASYRDRIRFNNDLAKLEKNDTYYKDKYEAVLTILRKYEHERQVPAAAAEQLIQQKKMFTILQSELEEEKTNLVTTLQKQTQQMQDLQSQLTKIEKYKDKIIQEQRAEIAAEQQRRLNAEQELIKTQQNITRNLDEKLKALEAIQSNESPTNKDDSDQARRSSERAGGSSSRDHPRVGASSKEVAGAEIARAYAEERRRLRAEYADEAAEEEEAEEVAYARAVRERERELQRRQPSSRPDAYEYVENGRSRGRSRTRPSSSGGGGVRSPSFGSDRSSSRGRNNALESERGRSRGRGASSTAYFKPARVASAQQILAMLPANAQVQGDIEFVLPEDGAPFYRQPRQPSHQCDPCPCKHQQPTKAHVRRSSITDPQYAQPTFSSDHSRALSEKLYPARSRSHSGSRSPIRTGLRSDIRDDVDRRVYSRRHRSRPDHAVPGVVTEEDEFVTPGAAASAVASERRARSHSRAAREAAAAAGMLSKVSERPASAVSSSHERVGPLVNGHSGVTIRVIKKGPPTAATKSQLTSKIARQVYQAAADDYEYERYGRGYEVRQR